MKICNLKKIGLLLILGICIPLFLQQNITIAQGAAPKFKKESIEIKGLGEVYELAIMNKVKGSKYQWYSSNNKVAKVSKEGLITAVNKGSATIRCKITYPSKKVKTLYCKVTVIIPATDIEINNALIMDNGTHVMLVGDKFNFNRTLTPSNSSDKTYWSIDASDEEANPNAIRIDDNTKGTVTAVRRGKIVLVATAAKASTAKEAAKSEVKDAIIIEVVGPSPEVISAQFTNSKEIKVVFGTAIKDSTVITNGQLSNNIEIGRLVDSSGNTARDPGILKARLSNDLKTLTITATNYFDGSYNVTFSKDIRTTAGDALYEDTYKLSYSTVSYEDIFDDDRDDDEEDSGNSNIDKVLPEIDTVMLDDKGMTTIITFKEQMDFSGFKVTDAKTVSANVPFEASTINYLNNEASYNFSSDGKSIYINMSNISSIDHDKSFAVTISGVTDTSGNRLVNDSAVVIISTVTAPKPQARPVSVLRTSYDTITATFDRSIKNPGRATVSTGSLYFGMVNPDNDKQVLYKLSTYDSTLSGNYKVSIGYWDSYNVISTDTYANKMHEFTVYFMTENIRPALVSHKFDPDLNVLTLIYSENVRLRIDSGYLVYTMPSGRQDSNNRGFVNYAKASVKDNVIEIMLKNLTIYGDYTITFPDGFAIDDYRNLSYGNTLTINNGNGDGGINVLAEPYSIYQSSVNHSFIFVEFADKLDETSALNINNYYLYGLSIEKVDLVKNSADGAIVRLTLGKGSITTTGKRKITITGLKGHNYSATQMADYTKELELVENIDPAIKSIKYNSTTKNSIDIIFTEAVQGNMVVNVYERNTGYPIGNVVTVAGDTVTITLNTTPLDGTYLRIYVLHNGVTDLNGNESIISPELNAFANY